MGLIGKLLVRTPRPCLEIAAYARQRSAYVDRLARAAAKMLRGQDLTIQNGLANGIRFNTGDSAATYILGTHKLETQLILGGLLQPGMVFYDIGSNVGFFAMIAARLVGAQGSVLCFEPLPANISTLRYNLSLNSFEQVRTYQVALGDHDGQGEFATSERPTWGRLESETKPDRYSGNIGVTIRRLDSLAREAALPPPDVIKIDVEGSEAAVIAGATAILREKRPSVIIELHGTGLEVMRELCARSYCAVPLERASNICDAHWNSSIIAIPAEKPNLMRQMCDLLGRDLPLPRTEASPIIPETDLQHRYSRELQSSRH